jgi:hypothetical protein
VKDLGLVVYLPLDLYVIIGNASPDELKAEFVGFESEFLTE